MIGRERERKQLPAPTANKVGPSPIATVFAPGDFILSINKSVKLDLIYSCAFVSSRDGRPENKKHSILLRTCRFSQRCSIFFLSVVCTKNVFYHQMKE